MITVDVEAQPKRAEKDPLDRLIWGKFPQGRFGLGEMMDIASERGVKLVTFLDYCEEHLYGDALLDVGREIHRRGHDLQLHAHADFLSADWWTKNGLEKKTTSLNAVDEEQAQKIVDFICDAHIRSIGTAPIAYRGGGYRFNQHTLKAAHKNGILLHSSFNFNRPKSYLGNLKRSKQFLWSNGCYEIPISTYQHNNKEKTLVEFNFNSAYFPTAQRMVDYLDNFYQQMGEDAIAVLVLHSWSFLELINNTYYECVGSRHMERFSQFLDLIRGKIEVIDSHQALDLLSKKEISLGEPMALSDLVDVETSLLRSPSQPQDDVDDTTLTSKEIISKAEQLWQDGSDHSTAEAVRLLKRLFDKGEVQGTAYRLGTAYYYGKGVEKNLEGAYKYFSLTQDRYSFYYRGLIFSDPNFSKFDLQLAYKNFSEALKRGISKAQVYIDKIFTPAIRSFKKDSLWRSVNKKETIFSDPTYCLICNQLMEKLIQGDKCPHCQSASRTRTFPIVMDALKSRIPQDLTVSLPLLGFAITGVEENILKPIFPNIISTSLYGTYGSIEGCDVRDLSRFENNSFCGISSILLFDYFTEIDVALAECARVTAPGGVFITHIAYGRLVDDEMAPTITSIIKKTDTYFPYLPDNANMPSITLGRQTFINKMKRVGYNAAHYSIQDDASGIYADWFVGFLPRLGSIEKNPVKKEQKFLPSYEKTYGIPLKKTLNPHRGRSNPPFSLSLRLSIPSLPLEARSTHFAEHVYDRKLKSATEQVILLGRSLVVESKDNGQSWIPIKLREGDNRYFRHCFTTDEGNHIIQAKPEDIQDKPCKNTNPERATLFLFDKNWKLLSIDNSPEGAWHGRASIDQSGDTIMFAEYHNNSFKYHSDYRDDYSKWRPLTKVSKVFRSQDGGHTWEVVFEVPPEQQIRHFHTIQADPFLPGTWWLSSGDFPQESRVWRSDDNGSSWIEVTNYNLQILVPDSMTQNRKQSAFRYTDLIITPDTLIWGTDDIMGEPREIDSKFEQSKRAGSRIYQALKSNPLNIEELGYVGHSVRSIVDVGLAYLFLTEANRGLYPAKPQVVALFKDDMTQPIEIAQIDNFTNNMTRLSTSLASKAVLNGRFFSYRYLNDAFKNVPPYMLQWDIDFNE